MELTPYHAADAAEVAALLSRVPEGLDTSEASFRAFTQLEFNRGARDFRVVRAGPLLIGLLASCRLEHGTRPLRHFRVVVDPNFRRRGLGTQLLAEAARQDQDATLQCNSQLSWRPGNAFLERHGFALANRELLMRSDGAPPDCPLPAPFTLREATRDDDAIWLALYEMGYGAYDDFVALTQKDLDLSRQQPGFSLWLAEREGVVVGKCHCWEPRPGQGLVSSVVVRPEYRGRGIARALCTRGIRALRAAGCRSVTLNVMASNEPAVRVYRRLGFETYDELRCYRR